MGDKVAAFGDALDGRLNFKSENSKYAFYLLLAVVLLVLAMFVVVSPLRDSMAQKRMQLMEKQQKLAAYQTFASQHKDYEAFEKEQKQRMGQVQLQLPDYVEVPEVLRHYYHLSEATNTTIESVKTPAVSSIKQQNGVYVVPFSVKLKGGYYNTVDFLQEIERGVRYASLQQVKVDGNESTGDVSMTAQLTVFSLKGVHGASTLPQDQQEGKTGLERVRERDKANMEAVSSVR